MENSIKLFRIGALSIVLLGSGVVMHKLYRSVCAVRYVVYVFSPTMSPYQQQVIKERVALFEYEGVYNPHTIIQVIKSFPGVKLVSMHCRASNTAEIVVDMHNPIICINGTHVVTDAKTVIPACFYALYVVDSLPSLSMKMSLPNHCSDRMIDTIMCCIKEHIFERYTLSWVNEHELYFHDIGDPSFSLLCDMGSLPTRIALASYEQVKNGIKRRNATASRWVADLRFADQIIVSRDKGEGHGKGV